MSKIDDAVENYNNEVSKSVVKYHTTNDILHVIRLFVVDQTVTTSGSTKSRPAITFMNNLSGKNNSGNIKKFLSSFQKLCNCTILKKLFLFNISWKEIKLNLNYLTKICNKLSSEIDNFIKHIKPINIFSDNNKKNFIKGLNSCKNILDNAVECKITTKYSTKNIHLKNLQDACTDFIFYAKGENNDKYYSSPIRITTYTQQLIHNESLDIQDVSIDQLISTARQKNKQNYVEAILLLIEEYVNNAITCLKNNSKDELAKQTSDITTKTFQKAHSILNGFKT